jgi:hypothetical protein
MNRAFVAILLTAPLVLVSACSKDEPPRAIINDYVTAVQVMGQEATSTTSTAQLPAGTPEGPTIKNTPDVTVVNGGSLQAPIEATAAIAKLRVALEPVAAASTSPDPGATPAPAPSGGTGPGGTPASGYLEISLKDAAASINVVLTVTQGLPGSFVFHYAAVDAGGKQGAVTRQGVSAIRVGTGQVQVSISWDVDSDVDLHVVDPNQDEIYYEEPEASSGGELDLDSNAECDLDHKKNENITWQKAPAGKFVVRVDYWDNCGVTATNYVVTVQVNGQPTRTFSGKLTGKGDQGGAGDGNDVTTFTVLPPTT